MDKGLNEGVGGIEEEGGGEATRPSWEGEGEALARRNQASPTDPTTATDDTPLPQSPKKVGEDIAKATGDWKGLRVTVQLTIQNRQAVCAVVPSASSLVIRALKGAPSTRLSPRRTELTVGCVSQSPLATAKRRRTSSTLVTSTSTGTFCRLCTLRGLANDAPQHYRDRPHHALQVPRQGPRWKCVPPFAPLVYPQQS